MRKMLRQILALTIMVAITGCGLRESQDSPPASLSLNRQLSFSENVDEAVSKILKRDRLWVILNRSESESDAMKNIPEWGPLQEVVDAAGVEVLVKPLIKGLRNSDGQMSAVYALGRIGPKAKSAVPALLELYGKLQGDKRQVVVIALGEIGVNSMEVIYVLTKAVTQDNSKYVRSSAAYSLGIIGVSSESVISALNEGLRDKEKCVRLESEAALGRLGHTKEAESRWSTQPTTPADPDVPGR